MRTNVKILCKYYNHSVDVYEAKTDLKGHIETSQTLLYRSFKCHIYNPAYTKNNDQFGIGSYGMLKILCPLLFEGLEVEILQNYVLHWIDSGQTKKLIVQSVETFDSHMQLTVQEVF